MLHLYIFHISNSLFLPFLSLSPGSVMTRRKIHLYPFFSIFYFYTFSSLWKIEHKKGRKWRSVVGSALGEGETSSSSIYIPFFLHFTFSTSQLEKLIQKRKKEGRGRGREDVREGGYKRGPSSLLFYHLFFLYHLCYNTCLSTRIV